MRTIERASIALLCAALSACGGGGSEPVPAKVEASARDLQGRRIDIPMRELRTGEGLVDNVGTFSITPPDTLQFTVQVTVAGAPVRTLEFTREVAK